MLTRMIRNPGIKVIREREFKVWSGKWKVWSVEPGVYSVECGM